MSFSYLEAHFLCGTSYFYCDIRLTWSDRCCVQCAKKLGIDFAAVSDCMNSTTGNEYEHAMALLTDLLNPKLTYVPWVTLNSVTSEQLLYYLCLFSGFVVFIMLTCSCTRKVTEPGKKKPARWAPDIKDGQRRKISYFIKSQVCAFMVLHLRKAALAFICF